MTSVHSHNRCHLAHWALAHSKLNTQSERIGRE